MDIEAIKRGGIKPMWWMLLDVFQRKIKKKYI